MSGKIITLANPVLDLELSTLMSFCYSSHRIINYVRWDKKKAEKIMSSMLDRINVLQERFPVELDDVQYEQDDVIFRCLSQGYEYQHNIYDEVYSKLLSGYCETLDEVAYYLNVQLDVVHVDQCNTYQKCHALLVKLLAWLNVPILKY